MASTTARRERFSAFSAALLECKSAGDGDGRTVEMIAAVFGNRDLGGDVMVKGAFATAPARLQSKSGIKLKFGHGELIGTVLEVKETDQGLWVKAQFADHPEFLKYAALVECGALTQASFGYSVLPGGAEFKTVNGKPSRLLKAVELYEVSLVESPMNEETQILGIKSMWPLADAAGSFAQIFGCLRWGEMSPVEANLARQLIDVFEANWRREHAEEASVENSGLAITISNLESAIAALPQ